MQLKKSNTYGESKELLVDSFTWGVNGVTKIKYGYKYSDTKFKRPNKSAYKITIHQSYRKNGKVKKKQYCVGTIDYYSIAQYSLYDSISDSRIKHIAQELDIDIDVIWNMIYIKYEPLESEIISEFEKTEEFKTKQKHDKILQDYRDSKFEFANKYECDQDEYDYCFNVFGELVNIDYLNQIKQNYKTQKDYERSSYRNSKQSNYNNNNNYSYSGYLNQTPSNYNEEEKALLKKFYKTLAQKYHPDMNLNIDTTKQMQLLNKLKDSWRV